MTFRRATRAPRFPFALATILLAPACALPLACGSSGGSPEAPGVAPEAGVATEDAAPGVTSVPDASLDAGVAVVADASATGRHLVARPAVFEGLTSDGHVVFSEAADGGGQVAEVIALDGTGETSIATGTAADKALRIALSGPVVFVWTNRGNRVATLTVWSPATGAVAKGSGVRPGRGAATADGAYVAYVANVTATTADVVVSAIGAASPATIATLNAGDTTCWQDVDLAFAGTPPRFVSYFCPDGATAFTLRSTSPGAPDGGAHVDLAAAVARESVGKDVVVYTDATGHLVSVAPDGTGAVPLASEVAGFALSASESVVAYRTTDGALATTPVSSAQPRVAVPAGGAQQAGPLSPDLRYVLFASALGDAGAGAIASPTDVKLALTGVGAGSDGGAGAIRALVTSPTACAGCLNDSFTPDTTHALALDPIDDGPVAAGTGPVRVFPLDGGADYRLESNVWTVLALGHGSGAASRFLFVESVPSATLSTGYAYAIYTRSLEPGGARTEIARGVEWLGVDEARANVVYSIPGSSEIAGVWVAPLL